MNGNTTTAILTAILIDDENSANEALVILLKDNCPNVEIKEVCINTMQARDAIIRHRPDVLFLDIAMPTETGIEFLRSLGSFTFEVVFVTAYNQYAIDALNLSAVAYILKPPTAAAISSAVIKVAEKRKQILDLERYKLLFELMHGNAGRMMLPGRNGLHEVVSIPDICYLRADGHATHFHLSDGRHLVTGTNMGEYRSALLPYTFKQAHRSYIVNMRKVTGYHAADQTLVLSCGSIPLGGDYRGDVLGWLRGE